MGLDYSNYPPFVAHVVAPGGSFASLPDIEHLKHGPISLFDMLRRALAGARRNIPLYRSVLLEVKGNTQDANG